MILKFVSFSGMNSPEWVEWKFDCKFLGWRGFPEDCSYAVSEHQTFLKRIE